MRPRSQCSTRWGRPGTLEVVAPREPGEIRGEQDDVEQAPPLEQDGGLEDHPDRGKGPAHRGAAA